VGLESFSYSLCPLLFISIDVVKMEFIRRFGACAIFLINDGYLERRYEDIFVFLPSCANWLYIRHGAAGRLACSSQCTKVLQAGPLKCRGFFPTIGPETRFQTDDATIYGLRRRRQGVPQH